MIKGAFQWLAGTEWFMRAGPRMVPKVERLIDKMSGGKPVGGDRSLVLMTTGARSGEPRRTRLACVREPDGSLLVVGSNFGAERHPAWTANLLARPEAAVSFQGREIPVSARLLTGDERAAVWPGLVAGSPFYERYTARSGRELRVFRLIPEQ
ncbi:MULTISPECIES: nitroreductase family deazaflavin-dependent oxidoreductase [Nonomuraea]|uniref:Nitroreductase family deazaflavin-dependent oxidoreductase n=1 Tax=Nonomuraea ferruginea TaxID=46174 RepID=A0ABT4T1K1_9ACTN|nr:nitroreductase family deazaflavin-dependent oxidoreductase [Nonomuraea ferruginea]MDA0643372.1 nitroreductase family deazaflavin-dependent oxidoreductase [Nonomuraea ferruginea]